MLCSDSVSARFSLNQANACRGISGLDILLYTIPGVSVALLSWGAYEALGTREREAQQTIKTLLDEKKKSQHLITETDDKPKKKTKQKDSILKQKHKQESFRAKLEIKLERANMLLRFEEYLLFCFLSAVGAALLAHYVGGLGWLLAVPLGVPGFFLPALLLNVKTWLRMKKAQVQFPEVLDTMVSCFKTGYGFNRAVQQVSDNYNDPWGTEFGKMALETSLGASLEDTLTNLARRIPNPDVDLFVTCILIQKDTGGNMTEMLGNLSTTCRDRFKLLRKVSAISAQGKLTAVIVCLVPLVVMGFMYLFVGEAVEEFISNPIGQVIIGLAMGWMAIGAAVLWKMVQIEV